MDLGTAMHDAIIRNDMEQMGMYIDMGYPVDKPMPTGNTPINLCVALEDIRLVQFLIDRGADLINTNLRPSPLHSILRDRSDSMNLNDRMGIIRILIQSGAAVPLIPLYDYKWSPLEMSLREPDVVELLIKAGCDIHVRDSFGLTMLMIAARLGEIKTMRLLIEAGADIESKDRYTDPYCGWVKRFIMAFNKRHAAGLNMLKSGIGLGHIPSMRTVVTAARATVLLEDDDERERQDENWQRQYENWDGDIETEAPRYMWKKRLAQMSLDVYSKTMQLLNVEPGWERDWSVMDYRLHPELEEDRRGWTALDHATHFKDEAAMAVMGTELLFRKSQVAFAMGQLQGLGDKSSTSPLPIEVCRLILRSYEQLQPTVN
jgi:hypothetical protein